MISIKCVHKSYISSSSGEALEYTNCISAEWVRFPSPTSVLGMTLKKSDSEAIVTQSTILLPSLPDPLWPGVVAPDRVLFMNQIEVFDI